MISRRQFLLTALTAASLRAADDVAAHVERLGGTVERNAAGQITAVDLSASWANDTDLLWLADIPSLQKINLSRTRITGKALEPLRTLPHVQYLRLQFAEFLTATDIGHLAAWEQLQSLDLRGTRVDSGIFDRLIPLTSLEFLDLSSTEVDDEGFEELAALGKLTTLRCGANRLSGLALTVLKVVPALRHLDVGGYQRVDSGLWGLPLTEQNLERLGGLSQLESLSLRGAKLTDRGSDRPGSDLAIKTEIVGLEALAPLTNLRSLDLGDLPIKSADLSWLSSLGQLQQLDIDGSYQVDDATVPVLLALHNLKRLNLSGTVFSDAGLSQLAELPSLERLIVGGTQVSANAIAAFSQRRPNCRVISWKAS
jgi:Leucine-rich repeat (LRR) protein